MRIYYEPIDDSSLPELDRESVWGEDNISRLEHWRDLLAIQAEELAIMVEAQKDIPGKSTVGAAQRLGYTRIAHLWCRKRIAELRNDPDVDAPLTDHKSVIAGWGGANG